MATKKVTDENFETEVLKADKPTLVDFWAEWCGPCKQIGPILEEISNEMENQVVVAKHNSTNIPTNLQSMAYVVFQQCYFLKMEN